MSHGFSHARPIRKGIIIILFIQSKYFVDIDYISRFSTGDEANRKVTSSKETSSSPSVSCLSGKPQPVKLTHFFKLSSKKSVGKTSDGPESCISGECTGLI